MSGNIGDMEPQQFCQEKFRSDVFQDQRLGPMAETVICFFLEKWPKMLVISFHGGRLLMAFRDGTSGEGEKIVYLWKLFEVVDDEENVCEMKEVPIGEGRLDISIPVCPEELAQEALLAVMDKFPSSENHTGEIGYDL